MNLPRLIIADEIKPDVVPAGLVLLYAMQRAGMRVKAFACGRSAVDMRLLRLLLDEPVVDLDIYTCGSVRNLKTLFQQTADPQALNVILTPLGERSSEEDFFQPLPDVMDMARALSCGIVPVFSASTSAVVTSNIASSVLSAFETEEEKQPILGIIFSSPRNAREYQLLEQDLGRKTTVMSLGYIPEEIEKKLPPLQDLFDSGASVRVLQIKSAAIRLSSTINQIDWQILEAMARLKEEWTPPQPMHFPAKQIKVAIVGEKLFSLEGSNSAQLFRFLGCTPVDYDPWNDAFPKDAEVFYFPHALIALFADRLLAHPPFNEGIRQVIASNRLVFANGASAPFFARYFTTPDGKKHDGLGVFPFHGAYVSLSHRLTSGRVEIRSTGDNVFSKHEEKLRGYALNYVNISNPGNLVPPVWAYRDIRKDSELGNSGWVKSYCFVTDLKTELWSNIETVNRWLYLRRRV